MHKTVSYNRPMRQPFDELGEQNSLGIIVKLVSLTAHRSRLIFIIFLHTKGMMRIQELLDNLIFPEDTSWKLLGPNSFNGDLGVI